MLVPPGMDTETIRNSLLQAMFIGLAPVVEDRPAFVVPAVSDTVTYQKNGTPIDVTNVALDINGVPLDPTIERLSTDPTLVRIPCAVEFTQALADEKPIGNFKPTKAVLTVLDRTPVGTPPLGNDGQPLWVENDPIYDKVKTATDVQMGSDSYMIAYQQPVVGLGDMGVYTFVCFAREES